MDPSRFPIAVRALIDRFVSGAGATATSLRSGVLEHSFGLAGGTAASGAIPDDLAPFVALVARQAHTIVDADVAALLAAGRSEDEVFEVTLAAAMGAALAPLDAGLRALEAAGPATEPTQRGDSAAMQS